MKKQFIIIIAVIFVLLAAGFYVLKMIKPEYRIATLQTGNLIMAVLSLISFLMVSKQLDSRPQAFVRGVSGASFLKLMVCMVSMLVYVLLNRANIHKPTVFMLFGIYAVYTAAETVLLSKIAREQ